MQRVDTPSAISNIPAQEPTGSPGFFTKGDPALSVPATVPGQDWFNAVQEELIAIIVAAGLVPDKANLGQVLQALVLLGLRASTETDAGVAEVATQAEVDAGIDDSRIVTPLKLLTKMSAALAEKVAKAGDTMTGDLVMASGQFLYFEDGDHCISNNDGKGNFNIRVGHQTDETYSDDGMGAIHVEFSHETSNPALTFYIGEDATGKLAGDPVGFNANFTMSRDGNFYINGRAADAFDTGTIMLFQQTAAPTGWTKLTDHNNKALRLTAGTVVSGGSIAFSTAFSPRSVSSTTANGGIGSTSLSTSQMASHSHGVHGGVSGGGWPTGDAGYSVNQWNTSTEGDGLGHSHSFTGISHNHSIDMSVQYVDVIRAQKD